VGFHGCPPVTLYWQQVFMSMVIYTCTLRAELCGIPHLPKPGRYGAPVISYGPSREKLRLAGWCFIGIVTVS
jgi:hypothetical protein